MKVKRSWSRNSFITYLAVLDALHSPHGREAADERAALLHAVGLHLYPVKHMTTNSARLQRLDLARKTCFYWKDMSRLVVVRWLYWRFYSYFSHFLTLHPPLATTNSTPPPQQTSPGSCSTCATEAAFKTPTDLNFKGSDSSYHLYNLLGGERMAAVDMHHVWLSLLARTCI